MAQEVQYRGGGTAWHATFTGADREITVNTDTNRLHVHDGTTAGGHPLALYSEIGGSYDPDDVVLVDGTNPMEAALNLDSHKIVNLTDPTDAQDAATKNYVDGVVAGGVSDGDKGDIAVSGTGATWTIESASVTYAKIQNVSATDRILGRSTAGAGVVEEITCTPAARTVLDDTTVAAMVDTLGGASSGGTGGLARLVSPSFTTPALGTPSAAVLTNATGLPTAGLVDDAVTYAKIQDVSATDRILGRSTAGAGVVEEITCTAAGRALIDDADANAQLTTLGGATYTGTGGVVRATAPTITVADVEHAAAGLKVKCTTGAQVAGVIEIDDDLSTTRTLSLVLNDGNRRVSLVGDLTVSGTTTISTAAATVLDDASVSDMVNTLGGASSTGTGGIVRATSPTLVTPAIGTPSSGTLTSCTGLPISSGVSGLGTGVATFLTTPSSANLAAAVTDETGTGALVLATSPTLVTPALGTVASGNVAACAGMFYPLQVGFTTYNPNDAATNYFGNRYNSPTASADVSRVYVRKPGTITGADLWTFAGTAGDATAWEWFIRLNNTTDYSIQSVASSSATRLWTNSSLSIAVVAGDYIEIKMVNPTWPTTNPASISCGGFVYVQT